MKRFASRKYSAVSILVLVLVQILSSLVLPAEAYASGAAALPSPYGVVDAEDVNMPVAQSTDEEGDLWEDLPPADVVDDLPEMEAPTEMAEMLAPGIVRLTTERYLPNPGEEFNLTVRAGLGPHESVEGQQLVLTLPKGLRLLSGETSWTLPALEAGESFERSVRVKLTKGKPDEVFKVELTMQTDGYGDYTTDLLIGVGRPGKGVKVLLDPDIQAQGISANSRTQFFTGAASEDSDADTERETSEPEGNPAPVETDTDTQTEATPPDAATGLVSMFLPLLQGGAGSIAGNTDAIDNEAQPSTQQLFLPAINAEVATPLSEEETDGFVAIWQIDAVQASRKISELPQKATLVFDAQPLMEAGIDVESLALYTRENDTDAWQLVLSEYMPEEVLIVAEVSHFSQWGLGDKLAISGLVMPTVNGFASDNHTGNATVRYPVETPEGLGGMGPNLGLSYSSGGTDDLENLVGIHNYNVQADWTGFGWHLDGLSYIARDFSKGNYYLVMDGVSTKINWAGNGW
ncbi:MAG: hypothetical protein KDD84_22115, partial [Caldilineaceae bacterium]|nr:hypothetical protein [Caldilineaceae bacterium]